MNNQSKRTKIVYFDAHHKTAINEMENVIMPFTMIPLKSSVPRGPDYLTIQVRTVFEHVQSIVPTYLQGTQGILRLITSFIGPKYKWVQVKGDLIRMYNERCDRDLYFLFWFCSHRLPIPDTLTGFRTCCDTRRMICVDKGSQMLPIGRDGLYYTRTGHMGSRQELSHLIRTVSCRGFVTPSQPILPRTGHHIVITRRVGHWTPFVDSNTDVVHVDQMTRLDPNIQWDSVILDNIQPSTRSSCYLYPDIRHISGNISLEWVLFDTYFKYRKKTIIYMESRSTDIDIVDYMYLLQIRYRGETFIGATYTIERSSLMRVSETMILEGIAEFI